MTPLRIELALHRLSVTSFMVFLTIGIVSTIFFPISILSSISSPNLLDIIVYLLLMISVVFVAYNGNPIIDTKLTSVYRLSSIVVLLFTGDEDSLIFPIVVVLLIILQLHQMELEDLFRRIRKSVPRQPQSKLNEFSHLNYSANYIQARLRWIIELDLVVLIISLVFLSFMVFFNFLGRIIPIEISQYIAISALCLLLFVVVIYSYNNRPNTIELP